MIRTLLCPIGIAVMLAACANKPPQIAYDDVVPPMPAPISAAVPDTGPNACCGRLP